MHYGVYARWRASTALRRPGLSYAWYCVVRMSPPGPPPLSMGPVHCLQRKWYKKNKGALSDCAMGPRGVLVADTHACPYIIVHTILRYWVTESVAGECLQSTNDLRQKMRRYGHE